MNQDNSGGTWGGGAGREERDYCRRLIPNVKALDFARSVRGPGIV